MDRRADCTASSTSGSNGDAAQHMGVITTLVGNGYEVAGSTATSYCCAGSSRISMRTGDALYYRLSDRLARPASQRTPSA